MNAITATQPTKLDQFRMEILPPERRQELVAGMPPHVRPERFERNLVNALMQNPGLMQLDPRLIFREVSKAAALGLYLDPQLGEAYLIEAWNGKAKRKEPQLRIGYRGLIKLGRQSGEISMIYAHEVHKNDVFKASLGDDKKLVHEPDLFGDRGPIVGYYAVVKYKEGDTDFEVLTVAQAHSIRDRSDGWKAFSDGKIKSTPWATDESEMSKKTVIRRLTKRIPQSPELAEAIRIEDAAEYSELRPVAITPPAPPKPPAPPSQQISAPPPPDTSAADEAEIIDGETGEIIDQREIVTETGEDAGAVEADGEVIDDTTFFERLEEALAVVSDAATIEEVWTEFDPLARFDGKPNGEINQAIALQIKKRAEKRVGGGNVQA
jgi:phage RecT family recombinase